MPIELISDSTGLEAIDWAIVSFVEICLNNDPEYVQSINDEPNPIQLKQVIAHYRIVDRLLNELEGEATPGTWPGAPSQIILTVRGCFYGLAFKILTIPLQIHICAALDATESWLHEAVQTLNLLLYYGPEGIHYEDSHVVDMMNDTKPCGSLHSRFFRLLESCHQDWVRDCKYIP